jgi:hypothetical protein
MENLHVKIEQLEGTTLTIREGDALPLLLPEKIRITGDIKTVTSFIEKRKLKGFDGVMYNGNPGLQEIIPDRAIVEVDREKKMITLSLNPEDPNGAIITAKMEPNPDLEKFAINTGKKFTQQELIKLLKFTKRWFHDVPAYETLLKAYMCLDVKVTADLKNNAADNRGNRSNSFDKTIISNIPEDFILNIPIFKGQDSKKIRIEIILDSSDGSTKFWLESVELAELTELEGDKILNAELEACHDYVIVWK